MLLTLLFAITSLVEASAKLLSIESDYLIAEGETVRFSGPLTIELKNNAKFIIKGKLLFDGTSGNIQIKILEHLKTAPFLLRSNKSNAFLLLRNTAILNNAREYAIDAENAEIQLSNVSYTGYSLAQLNSSRLSIINSNLTSLVGHDLIRSRSSKIFALNSSFSSQQTESEIFEIDYSYLTLFNSTIGPAGDDCIESHHSFVHIYDSVFRNCDIAMDLKSSSLAHIAGNQRPDKTISIQIRQDSNLLSSDIYHNYTLWYYNHNPDPFYSINSLRSKQYRTTSLRDYLRYYDKILLSQDIKNYVETGDKIFEYIIPSTLVSEWTRTSKEFCFKNNSFFNLSHKNK